MAVERISDIPRYVELTNPGDDKVLVRNVIGVDPGKTKVVDLNKYKPELRMQLYVALMVNDHTKVLTVRTVTGPGPVPAPEKKAALAPTKERDDFMLLTGMDNELQDRLHAAGIETYEDFIKAGATLEPMFDKEKLESLFVELEILMNIGAQANV